MGMGHNIVAFDADRGRSASTELAAGTELLHGQYTLMGHLASGGFGITYRATDSLGRSVVVKECFPDQLCRRDGQNVRVRHASHSGDLANITAQFVAEARSLARLRHRGIVEVHQVFMENETAYIAMEHVEGPDLLSLIEDGRRAFRPGEIEGIAKKLLKCIGYVHKRGLIHRDIAPDNIIIEPGGQPKLIDFGAVRASDGSGEGGFQLKCVKDGYSPEEFYDPLSRHGIESDLYSLGATLFHMVTGQAPVDAEMRRRATDQGQGDPYLPLAGRYRGYSRGFLEAIDVALSLAPQERHRSARDWVGFITSAATAPRPKPRPDLPLYAACETPPAEDVTDAQPERDLMPWFGVAAAAAGVALALLGNPPLEARVMTSAPMPGAPVVEASPEVVRPAALRPHVPTLRAATSDLAQAPAPQGPPSFSRLPPVLTPIARPAGLPVRAADWSPPIRPEAPSRPAAPDAPGPV